MAAIRGDVMSMIFQEPTASLNPLMTVGAADHRGAGHPPQRQPRRRLQGGARDARGSRHRGARAAHETVSVRALRRHVPARDDRDRADLPPAAADRRRADHRARRHHPGADPCADQKAAPRHRHRAAADHPRHGRRRRHGGPHLRDVCRARGRGRRRVRAVPPPASSLHQAAAEEPAVDRRGSGAACSARSRAPCRTCARGRPAAASTRAARSRSNAAASRRRRSRRSAIRRSARPAGASITSRGSTRDDAFRCSRSPT